MSRGQRNTRELTAAYRAASASLAGALACAGPAAEPPLSVLRADTREPALRSFASCDELLAGLRAELMRQVNERADVARMPPSSATTLFDDALGRGLAPAAASADAPARGALAELAHLQTEADRIYMLDGQALHVLQAWPSEAADVIASVPIEGAPLGLLVHSGVAAVLSSVAGELPGIPDEEQPAYYTPAFSKLTLVDTTVSPPRMLRETFFEGYAFSARQVGSVVWAVVQQPYEIQLDAPSVSYVDSFGRPRSQAQIDRQVNTWVSITRSSIEDTTLEDFLPTGFERVGGVLEAQPVACQDYLLSTRGVSGFGTTGLVGIDLAAPGSPFGTLTLVGYDGEVYVDADAAIVRQHHYLQGPAEPGALGAALHLFALNGVEARHTASGHVAGYLPTRAYFDERDGVIRAAPSDALGSRFVTLGDASDGWLRQLGASARIGGETPLAAPLFAGGRAFGLTSTSVSPGQLVVADLSDPAAPELAGAMAFDAHTNQLVSLGDDRLLAAAQTIEPLGSRVVLSLFDVSGPAEPTLVAEHVYGEPSSTVATYDSGALRLSPSQGLLALPVSLAFGAASIEVFGVSGAGLTRLGGVAPEPRARPLLECLSILGYPSDADYLAQLGQDPEQVASILEQCSVYGPAPLASFSVLRDDVVVTFAGSSVATFALDALSAPPLVQIELPNLVF